MKTTMPRKWGAGIALLAASLLTPSLVRAQDGPATLNQDPNADTQTAGANQDTPTDPGQPPVPAYVAGGNIVHQLGRANPLGEGGPMAWGPVSVRDAQVSEFYGNTTFYNVPGPIPNQSVTATVFESTVAFDKLFDHYHLTLQYKPTMYIDNGTVSYNASQATALETLFRLNDRWNLTVKDDFSYYASQRVITNLGLDLDYETLATAESPFLNGPGTTLYNATGGTFSYLWSPRTIISFGPDFVYERSTGALAAGELETAKYTGGTFDVAHFLSAFSKIEFAYNVEYATLTDTVPKGEPTPGNGVLQDFHGTYYRNLSPTLKFEAGAGVATGTGTASAGTSLELDAGVTKTYQRAEFAVVFSQGRQFSGAIGVITNQATDRVDGLMRIYLTPRLITTTTSSYFTTIGSGPTLSGYYATTQLGYQLAPHVSLVGTGSYISQSGDNVFEVNANRYLVSVGIHWDAAAPALH